MSTAVKEIKTKKESNTDLILAAVNSNKPITIRAYYLNDSTQESLKFILALILQKYNKSESLEICFNSVKSLVVNAMKANIKRVLFNHFGLDIANPKEYKIGMEKIGNRLVEKNFYKFKDELMKRNLAVNTSFLFNPDGFSITVKNYFILFPHEYELNLKSADGNITSLPLKELKPGEKISPNSTKVVSLDQYKIDQQIFSQSSNADTNETIVKLDIVLKDKNTFNTETFGKEMDALHSSYKEKFKEVIEGKSDPENEKVYQTISRSYATSIRGAGDFLNQLNRVQTLDSKFYKEQQLLLANYGENVFKTIQEKLYKARIESDAYVGQIQKIGKEVFDINKNKIQEFIENRDIEIEKQTNTQIEKHKKKIDKLNSILDSRIENQSIILNGQVNAVLDQLDKSSIQLFESTNEEISKLDSLFEKKSNALKNQVKQHFDEMNDSSMKLIDSTKNEISKLDSIIANKSNVLKEQVSHHLDEMSDYSMKLINSSKKEISNLDSIIESKSNSLKNQMDKSLEEMSNNSSQLLESAKKEITELDLKFENKSSFLREQVNQHLELLHSSNMEFIASTNEGISKLKEDIKLELNSELDLAELRKYDILTEINSEKESLESSLRSIKEEVKNLEKYQKSKEVMENFVKLSDEAFWRMSENIEVIQEKELKINKFMSNINLLEIAIRNTEKEIKNLDIEKTDYLTKKGKVVESIDSKIKQMEKFGEEMKEKLNEISGFERKLNIISGSLTEQVKKTKTIDEQLSKFNREVFALESKKKELSHFVNEVDRKVDLIDSKTGDIKFMESKFKHIENMMIDLSSRHKQIITMETRLEDVKSNIENLIHQSENKISEMTLAMQKKTAKTRRKKIIKSF